MPSSSPLFQSLKLGKAQTIIHSPNTQDPMDCTKQQTDIAPLFIVSVYLNAHLGMLRPPLDS